MAVHAWGENKPKIEKPTTEEIPKEKPEKITGQADYINMNLPNGARISAQGQLIITVVTLSFVSIYCCEKVYQVTCRVLERINANPENQR